MKVRTILFLLCGTPVIASAQASFQGLGALTVGGPSIATGISADGSVIVGESFVQTNRRGFRWNFGIQNVGTFLGISGETTGVTGVSADGQRLAVNSSFPGGQRGIWYEWGQSFTVLSSPSGGAARVNAISADGNWVGGRSGSRATVWSRDGTPIQYNPASGSFVGEILSLSFDGNFAVGIINATGAPPQAARWAGNQPQLLGYLPGFTVESEALGVSADGKIVVGFSSSAESRRAFRWSPSSGMQSLGTADGVARGVSADGTVIVGESGGAFFWTEGSGVVNLQQHLTNLGLESALNGWQLGSANAVTVFDGNVIIAGTGLKDGVQQAYRAVVPVPEPGTLVALGFGALAVVRRRRASR